MKKECSVCKNEKLVSEFYKHKAMKDGLLNKCKDCVRLYSKTYYSDKLKDPFFLEKEKERHRNKYHRLNKNWIKNPNNQIKSNENYALKYPEKIKAKNLTSHIKIEEGFHKHHWSYLTEHCKDVVILKSKQHYEAHRYIIYDQERMMYRRCDNMELLDTKEKHVDFIMSKITV